MRFDSHNQATVGCHALSVETSLPKQNYFRILSLKCTEIPVHASRVVATGNDLKLPTIKVSD